MIQTFVVFFFQGKMTTKCRIWGGEKENMSSCSKCHIVHVSYCSRKCQMKNWHKSHKNMCKSLKTNEQNGDVTSLISAPEELHNQECSPVSCTSCGRKFGQNKNWYKHKQNCQQNHGIVEIQTDGYKKLIRKTHVEHLQSTIFQRTFIHVYDSAPNENFRIFGPNAMRRSDYVDFSIRKSLFRNINGIIILFEIIFLLLPLLGLVLLLCIDDLFLLCCLFFLSSFELDAQVGFSDQNLPVVSRRHRRWRRRNWHCCCEFFYISSHSNFFKTLLSKLIWPEKTNTSIKKSSGCVF